LCDCAPVSRQCLVRFQGAASAAADGQTTARAQRCHLPARLAGLHSSIEALVTSRPDATIAELREWLCKTHQVSASTGLMWKTLAALDLTFKKKSLRAAEQDRPDVAEARTQWRQN
jgi:transposase